MKLSESSVVIAVHDVFSISSPFPFVFTKQDGYLEYEEVLEGGPPMAMKHPGLLHSLNSLREDE